MLRTLITYLAVIIAAAAAQLAFGNDLEGHGLLILGPLLLPSLLFVAGKDRLGWLLTGALVLEIAGAQLSWHTVGEVHAAMVHLLVWFNALVVVAARLGWRRRTSIVLLTLFAMLVPYHVVLGLEWIVIHDNAERMLQTARTHQARTGVAPEALPHFEPSYVWVGEHLSYRIHDGEPIVHYWVGTRSTSHWSTNDGWGYYPD